MSMPSVLSDDHLLVNCGRANARLNKVTTATRNAKGTCNNHIRQLFGCVAEAAASEIYTLASLFHNSYAYQPIIGSNSSNKNKYPGLANVILLPP